VKETIHQQVVVPLTSSAAERDLRGRVPAGLLGVAFVLFWSSGYPAARIALDHSGPFTLLMLRFGGAGLIFAALAGLNRVAWPRGRAALHSALVGTLQLGLQFGALYWAASHGVNIGLIALVIGTMPIVTALLGRALFREVVRPLQWIGFALGFAGVALAVGASITPGRGAGAGAYLAVFAGLLAISVGTLYQKRHASNVDLRSGLALQHLAATVLLLPFAVHEGFRADTSPAFFASLGWVIGVNSLTTFALFFVLLRRGVVNQVAALFFLMPPATAVIDYLVLGDALTAYKVAGLALAALGVYLATRPRPESAAGPEAPLRSAGLLDGTRTAATRTRLRDGREVLIRPIGPADLDALKRFFVALSPATSRLRFHASMKEVPERLLREFTTPDQRQHVGFIAEADGRAADEAPLLVAEARFVRCPGSDAAEFALVVADGWRRVGLGSSLTQTLLHHARLTGVQRLCGDALADNEALQRFMRSLGASRSGRIERADTVRLCLRTGRDQRGYRNLISAAEGAISTP
jgi:drug/metabolite transporter (DMT)-like permease/RimJ/RimL family protein N-acetyltransferase